MKFAITSWVIVFIITTCILNNVSNSIHKNNMNMPILEAVKYEEYRKERQKRHKERQSKRIQIAYKR